MKAKPFTFQDHLKQSLKDPSFKKAWKESEAEYQIARQMIKTRIKNKLTQRSLAKKAHTTQAVISRLETMSANPSLALLQKISTALDQPLRFTIHP